MNHQITCNKWEISKTEHMCSPSFAVVPRAVLLSTPSPQEDSAETWNSYSVSGVRPLTLRCNSLAGNVFLLSSRNEVLYDFDPFHSIWEENERRLEEVSTALMNAEIQLMVFHSRKMESGCHCQIIHRHVTLSNFYGHLYPKPLESSALPSPTPPPPPPPHHHHPAKGKKRKKNQPHK